MARHYCCVLLAIGLAPLLSSCRPTVDVEKEKEAIKAVLEEEKAGYFAKDLNRIAATWVQSPSSVKMFLSEKEEVGMFGWEKIAQRDKEDISMDWSTYKEMGVDYSDFRFTIYETSAWAVFKAKWHWTVNDVPGTVEQTRIMAFEKNGGKWKITLMAIYAVPREEKQETQ